MYKKLSFTEIIYILKPNYEENVEKISGKYKGGNVNKQMGMPIDALRHKSQKEL